MNTFSPSDKVLAILQRIVNYNMMVTVAKKKFFDCISSTECSEVYIQTVKNGRDASAMSTDISTPYGDFKVHIRLMNSPYDFQELRTAAKTGQLPTTGKEFAIHITIVHEEFAYTVFGTVDVLTLPGLVYDKLYEIAYNTFSHMETTLQPRMWDASEIGTLMPCFDALKRSALGHFECGRGIRRPTSHKSDFYEHSSHLKYSRFVGESPVKFEDIMHKNIDEDVLFNLTLMNISSEEINNAARQMGYWHKNTEFYSSEFELFLVGNVQ